MQSDIELANAAPIRPIADVARDLGIGPEELEFYGKYKAKISEELYRKKLQSRPGKLILVTAINPTPAGEGKTTTTIGLGQAMAKLGEKAVIALREPSLGPVFGIKGGAAGGGYSQVIPMEDINLHFTGDIHAVTAANNLLCAIIDNHIHQGNTLSINPGRVVFRRCMDMNDRALRDIVVGLGGEMNGVPREDGFNISVASEIMAILCLAGDMADLKRRLGNILVAYRFDGPPVYCRDLKVQGALAALLRDAVKPNLVQTMEGTPAVMHGGPFANIAHGCNSVRATRFALASADYCITEAGFGSELGAEKFFDIKCRVAGLKPSAAVLVATARALKYNGGVPKEALKEENVEALRRGADNLRAHIAILKKYHIPVIVAVNRFYTDTEAELRAMFEICRGENVDAALSEVFEKGGEGGLELARLVVEKAREESNFRPLYDAALPLSEKIETIAREIYGADGVDYSKRARKALEQIEHFGGAELPVCIAKTQYSLSDDPTKLGRPHGFRLQVKDARLSAGAGFVVALAGDIMTMPGLPRRPAAEGIDVTDDGKITGLF